MLDDEKLLYTCTPHLFSFSDLYFVWIWIIILSVAFMAYGDKLASAIPDPTSYAFSAFDAITSNKLVSMVPVAGGYLSGANSYVGGYRGWFGRYSKIGAWLLTVVVSSLIFSVLKIEFKWVAILIGVAVLSIILALVYQLPPESVYHLSIILSLIGAAIVDVYRRSHVFYVTNRRIVTAVYFAGKKKNEIPYDKINNVILHQGLVGSLFNFGTIIPVTASGLGMGHDFSQVSVGVGGQKNALNANVQVAGGRGMQVPRSKSMYCLWGVGNPKDVHRAVSECLHGSSSSPYLKKITEQLDRLTDALDGDD